MLIDTYKKTGEYSTQERIYNNLDDFKLNKGHDGIRYTSIGILDDCMLDPVQ